MRPPVACGRSRSPFVTRLATRVLTAYIGQFTHVLPRFKESAAMRATCGMFLPFAALRRTLVPRLSFPRNDGVRGSSPRVGLGRRRCLWEHRGARVVDGDERPGLGRQCRVEVGFRQRDR